MKGNRDMKTITIKDIAKKCGVGVSTVSRAINNHPDISDETREKILQVIKENNFVPNSTARSLKCTQTETIAVLKKNNQWFNYTSIPRTAEFSDTIWLLKIIKN